MLFDSRKVEALTGLNYQQRMLAMRAAYDLLPIPKKAILNTIKFLLLAPVFFIIAKEQSWGILPWIMLTVILYPLVTKPLTLFFVKPYLTQAVKDLKVTQ